MDRAYHIITVDEQNLIDHPQVICYINPKHPAYPIKIEWLKKRFSEGLKIKLLYLAGEKRPVGFIEYVPGEYCWRAVSAQGYQFIHCIWISANKYKNKGFGTLLIDDCLRDAEENQYLGVVAMTSSGAFMADKGLFLKNGFRVVDKAGSSGELLVKSLNKGSLPRFNDWESALEKFRGLHILYSNQCPWVARFVSEMTESLHFKGVDLTITELKSPLEAQAAPSPYAVFNLIYDGRLLADHYISETRFMNILRKEKLL